MARKPKQPTKPESPKQRDGRCDKCGNGGFRLRSVKMALIRKCKQCGDEVIVG